MTRVYMDTEFAEDGRIIDLISIGMVREDGREYYAECQEADFETASLWVLENVVPYLTGPLKPRDLIARELVDFCGPNPEFWAWYGAYDWVALCQLFGTMMNLPRHWPMFVRDFKQATSEQGVTVVQPDDSVHHALDDARWLRTTMQRMYP